MQLQTRSADIWKWRTSYNSHLPIIQFIGTKASIGLDHLQVPYTTGRLLTSIGKAITLQMKFEA
jgi:hypothetical protein